jgi:hypothetical protein
MSRPSKVKEEGKKMDEFITELKSNINEGNSSNLGRKTGRIQTLIRYFANSNPEIEILEKCTEEGDIRYAVSMRSMGITYETLMKYRTEFCGPYIINFMGEMLVRDNLDIFAKCLVDLKDNYNSLVNRYEHKKFGMRIEKDKFVFIFHMSLLQTILTEDFKKGIN